MRTTGPSTDARWSDPLWTSPGAVRALAAASLLLLTQCQGRSERAFTQQVAARIREQNPGANVRVTASLTLEVEKPDGTKSTHSLDNLWRECGSRPTDCGEPLERYVRLAAGELPKVENAATLRVVLRDREFVTQMQAALRGARSPKILADSQPVLRPFVGDLLIGYVFDSEDGMQVVSRGALAKLGLTEAALHDRALANTEAALEAIPYEPMEPGSSLRMVSAGDSYEASRVLLHERWRPIARAVRGDLLVSAPARDTVIFTGSREDVKGLRALAGRISTEQHHPLSPTILQWTEDSWVVFDDVSRP